MLQLECRQFPADQVTRNDVDIVLAKTIHETTQNITIDFRVGSCGLVDRCSLRKRPSFSHMVYSPASSSIRTLGEAATNRVVLWTQRNLNIFAAC